MREVFVGGNVSLVVALLLSAMTMAQSQGTTRSPWKYYPTDVPAGDGGPAPSAICREPGTDRLEPAIQGSSGRKTDVDAVGPADHESKESIGKYCPAGTNDPTATICDPIGFPENVYNEGRALSIATMPNRAVILF